MCDSNFNEAATIPEIAVNAARNCTTMPRYPRLGISAVIRSVQSTPSTTPLPTTSNLTSEEDLLRIGMPPPLTCRFRPSLRPVKIVDSFRLRRRTDNLGAGTQQEQQENVGSQSVSRRISEQQLLGDIKWRPISLVPQGRRRKPLKAFQQNTLPANYRSRDLSLPNGGNTLVANSIKEGTFDSMPPQARQLPPPAPLPIRPARISTNPRVRRRSSSSMATTPGSCTEDEVRENPPKPVSEKMIRKRRSTLFGSAKKSKRGSLSSLSQVPKSPESDKEGSGKGIVLRLRSSTQGAFEAMRRVVGRRLSSNNAAMKTDRSKTPPPPPTISESDAA